MSTQTGRPPAPHPSLRREFRSVLVSEHERKGRLPFLVNDFVIEEQLCHLRCSYCLTEDYNLLMEVPDAQIRLTTDARDTWHAVLDHFHNHVDCPVLRVSGGEFFWLKKSAEFIQECAGIYETVQIITNGVLLRNKLDQLAAPGNVQLNISLDGHTNELNRYRFTKRQPKLLGVVLENLARAVELGIKVDIQCVLTDANVEHQLSFAEFLADLYPSGVTLYFFPARGTAAKRFAYEPGNYLDAVVERYDDLSPVLPPRAFVEHIAEQLRRGERTLPCHITAMMAQLFATGDVSACPHAWIDPMVNIVDEPDSLPDLVGEHPHYHFFMQRRPRFSFCKKCATPSDVVNLYLMDIITDAEIAACHLYSGEQTLVRLRELKELYAPAIAG